MTCCQHQGPEPLWIMHTNWSQNSGCPSNQPVWWEKWWRKCSEIHLRQNSSTPLPWSKIVHLENPYGSPTEIDLPLMAETHPLVVSFQQDNETNRFGWRVRDVRDGYHECYMKPQSYEKIHIFECGLGQRIGRNNLPLAGELLMGESRLSGWCFVIGFRGS